MKKLLVVVDMQNDFIDGSLGTKEAQAIVPNVVEKIKSWDGNIAITRDFHINSSYLDTVEGKHLPIKHCIYNTEGVSVNKEVEKALPGFFDIFTKYTFGSIELAQWSYRMKFDSIELIGVCTDICVISNALMLKAFNPDIEITVDANCCAGTTPEAHNMALEIMKNCHINIV